MAMWSASTKSNSKSAGRVRGEYDLGDDAIVKKIDKRAAAADNKLSKAPKKRNVGAPRKKTSVVHVMFEKVDGKEGAYRCLASVLPCKTGHPNVA